MQVVPEYLLLTHYLVLEHLLSRRCKLLQELFELGHCRDKHAVILLQGIKFADYDVWFQYHDIGLAQIPLDFESVKQIVD